MTKGKVLPRLGQWPGRFPRIPDCCTSKGVTYAQMIKPGEEIHSTGGQRFHVLAVVPFDEEDE